MRDEIVYKRLTEKELTDINTACLSQSGIKTGRACLRPVSQNF